MCPKRISQLRKINLFYHSKYALIRFYSDKLKSQNWFARQQKNGGLNPQTSFLHKQFVKMVADSKN